MLFNNKNWIVEILLDIAAGAEPAKKNQEPELFKNGPVPQDCSQHSQLMVHNLNKLANSNINKEFLEAVSYNLQKAIDCCNHNILNNSAILV